MRDADGFSLEFISAKFDPPTIVGLQPVPKKYGCLRLSWCLSEDQAWTRNLRLSLDVRLRTAESSEWIDPPVSAVNFTLNVI